MPGTAGRSGRLPDLSVVDDGGGVLPIAGGGTHPAKPSFMSGEASQLWDSLIEQVSHRLKPEDMPLLQSACELWGLYRASYDEAVLDPTDKDARIAVTSYWAKFEQAAARFGLNPADRQRLKTPPVKQGVRRRQA